MDNLCSGKGKADALQYVEGSRPVCAMVSIQVTTGVYEQSMYLKGWLGNWREPTVSLYARRYVRYRGRIADSEQTRDGLLVVLADNSTDGQMCSSDREGGEVRPKRPTVGKEKPGITFSGMNHGRDSEPTNRVTMPSGSARGKSLS